MCFSKYNSSKVWNLFIAAALCRWSKIALIQSHTFWKKKWIHQTKNQIWFEQPWNWLFEQARCRWSATVWWIHLYAWSKYRSVWRMQKIRLENLLWIFCPSRSEFNFVFKKMRQKQNRLKPTDLLSRIIYCPKISTLLVWIK